MHTILHYFFKSSKAFTESEVTAIQYRDTIKTPVWAFFCITSNDFFVRGLIGSWFVNQWSLFDTGLPKYVIEYGTAADVSVLLPFWRLQSLSRLNSTEESHSVGPSAHFAASTAISTGMSATVSQKITYNFESPSQRQITVLELSITVTFWCFSLNDSLIYCILCYKCVTYGGMRHASPKAIQTSDSLLVKQFCISSRVSRESSGETTLNWH